MVFYEGKNGEEGESFGM